jgi:predicted DNA-binding ribbon-helix-helix protein
VNTDPILYESRTRALRIHGVVTTVRLENLFWNVLQEIAEREDLTTSQFIAKLHDELLARHGDMPMSFASFLRVCCLRYLSQKGTDAASLCDGRAPLPFQPVLAHAS